MDTDEQHTVNDAQVTVAFVDDHPLILDGLKRFFAAEPAYRVVATGDSASEARLIAETHRPDVLFMDLSMPGNAFSVIADVVRRFHKTKVIVCTTFSSVYSAMRAFDAGASGFVLKTSPMEDLVTAVELVRRGELYITAQFKNHVMGGLRNKSRLASFNQAVKLTVRERQILDHLGLAKTNREIALSLSISEKTVRRHSTTLMQKLHARNHVELVIQSLDHPLPEH